MWEKEFVWLKKLLHTSFIKNRMIETRKTKKNNPKTPEDFDLVVDKYSSPFESYETQCQIGQKTINHRSIYEEAIELWRKFFD